MARAMAGVLSADTKARAFPELRVRLQRVLGLTNQIALALRDLAAGMEDAEDGALSGEVGQVRAERRTLMGKLGNLPVDVRDFVQREARSTREWDALSQRLQSLALQTDKMRAIVNGLRRLTDEKEQFNVQLSPARLKQLKQALRASEAELDGYQERIGDLREQLERGRMQVGFGGPGYSSDATLRDRFVWLVQREFSLALAGQAGEDAKDFAEQARPYLLRLQRVQARLDQLRQSYQSEVTQKAAVLLAQVEAEHDRVDVTATGIESLDEQTKQVFGELALRSFQTVQQKLGSILLRADVGISQQAWEVRQAHFEEVQRLQRTRAKNEKQLEEEFDEVMFDARGSDAQGSDATR
jgi:hypothetical protein